MGIRNYQEYTVTAHAQDRILTRFNITKAGLDKWLARLLSQCVYVETESERRFKYRKDDIVVIADPKQRAIITVYSINEHDDNTVGEHTTPEVQTVLREAVRKFSDTKRVKTAMKISEDVKKMYEANLRMTNPNTPHKFTNRAWEEFVLTFNQVRSVVDSTQSVIDEAERKLK